MKTAVMCIFCLSAEVSANDWASVIFKKLSRNCAPFSPSDSVNMGTSFQTTDAGSPNDCAGQQTAFPPEVLGKTAIEVAPEKWTNREAWSIHVWATFPICASGTQSKIGVSSEGSSLADNPNLNFSSLTLSAFLPTKMTSYSECWLNNISSDSASLPEPTMRILLVGCKGFSWLFDAVPNSERGSDGHQNTTKPQDVDTREYDGF